MNLTISPQIRIVALVGLLAVVGLAGSMLVLGRSGSATKTDAAATRAHTTTAAHTAPATTTSKPVATKRQATHAAKPAHRAKPRKPSAYYGNKVYAALPAGLQWQLAHHKIVVVSIYNPKSDVDAISVAEAHAGATDAGVGFLLVSVLDNEVAGILTALLPGGGLLPDPGVLVYRAPGDIALRLDGFADRDSVAQAATNALAGETGPAAPATAVPAATPTPAPATSAPAPTVTP